MKETLKFETLNNHAQTRRLSSFGDFVHVHIKMFDMSFVRRRDLGWGARVPFVTNSPPEQAVGTGDRVVVQGVMECADVGGNAVVECSVKHAVGDERHREHGYYYHCKH